MSNITQLLAYNVFFLFICTYIVLTFPEHTFSDFLDFIRKTWRYPHRHGRFVTENTCICVLFIGGTKSMF